MKFKLFTPDRVTAEGLIEGYGSTFGNVDSYGDVVEKGAFAASLAAWRGKGKMPRMLWMHRPAQPIGVWESMVEDDKGLRVKGRLLLGVQLADEALIMLRGGAIDGLSIGYNTVREKRDGAVNRLMQIDLREVSVVTDGANEQALIDSVKARAEACAAKLRAGDYPTIREFEGLLRDAGFSKSVAAAVAAVGYQKAVRREAEGEEASNVARLLGLIRA